MNDVEIPELKKSDGVTDVDPYIRRDWIVKRFETMLGLAENIEMLVRDGNSIYAVYAVDYEHRRKAFTAARGYCFRLICALDHVAGVTAPGTNIQKYVNLGKRVEKLAQKIKNLISSDDERRKKKCKEYQ